MSDRHRESPLLEGYGEAGRYVSENKYQKSLWQLLEILF